MKTKPQKNYFLGIAKTAKCSIEFFTRFNLMYNLYLLRSFSNPMPSQFWFVASFIIAAI